MCQDPRPDPVLEREAIQGVARLMLTWAARLGPWSDVALGFEDGSEVLLELVERQP